MKKIFFSFFFYLFTSSLFAEILIFKNCSSEDFEFEKNDYKIDISRGVWSENLSILMKPSTN